MSPITFLYYNSKYDIHFSLQLAFCFFYAMYQHRLWIIFLLSFYFTFEKTSAFFYLGEEDFIFTLPKDPPLLTEKMKGLLRGLKYISNMFDEKEPEMQIGLPTDVKHVAHIGMDGPSANKPSWMSEFNSAPELSSVPLNGNPQVKQPSAAGNHDSLPPLANEKQKKQRRKPSIGNGSPTGSPKGIEKHSRRHRSSNLSIESPGRDSSCHGRRHQNSSRGSDSSSQELPDVTRGSRRKKPKGSSGGSEGSTSSTRSKGPSSLPDIMELES
ncbi:CRIB domain-containing protein RIC5-like [Durio zibethinus]|uniref:CRIB domain-containing protein RIC5-like n=1 Tax=Durio zibethinus TaxID=66656 RepID=A0A6P5X0R7_DURZI|nr:CRIB domain-containing protein RIC5-like [Durio zibethinus]